MYAEARHLSASDVRMVQHYLAEGRAAIVVLSAETPAWAPTPSDPWAMSGPDRIALEVRRMRGPAPFTGSTVLMYEWPVAVWPDGAPAVHGDSELFSTNRTVPGLPEPEPQPAPEPERRPTWRDVAAVQPDVVQAYVQERGPLPDGPITQESWEKFYAWLRRGD